MSNTLKIFLTVLTVAAFGVNSYGETFSDYGIWDAISGVALLKGGSTYSSVVSASDRDGFINYLIYGVAAGDSLKFTLTVYGGMSANLSDSVQFQSILSQTVRQVKTSKVYAIADTLNASSGFPYLYAKITNNHADSSETISLWAYSKKQNVSYIRLK